MKENLNTFHKIKQKKIVIYLTVDSLLNRKIYYFIACFESKYSIIVFNPSLVKNICKDEIKLNLS